MSGQGTTGAADGPGGGRPGVPIDLVRDDRVAIRWSIPEAFSGEARRPMSPRFALHAPPSFAAECGNAIWKEVAQRREPGREAGREILDELLASPRQIHDAERLTALAYDLAHDVGDAKLAIHDFVDLALAVALDCRLVTADRPFRDAVRATPSPIASSGWPTPSGGKFGRRSADASPSKAGRAGGGRPPIGGG